MKKNKLIEFIAVLISAVMTFVIVCLSVWLMCFGFGIDFNIKYVCPIYGFVLINKIFPFQVHRIISK